MCIINSFVTYVPFACQKQTSCGVINTNAKTYFRRQEVYNLWANYTRDYVNSAIEVKRHCYVLTDKESTITKKKIAKLYF